MSAIHPIRNRISFRRTLGADLFRRLFVPLGLLGAMVAVLSAALGSWLLWWALPFGQPSPLELHMRLGLGAALLVAFFTVLRREHRLAFYVAGESSPQRVAHVWNLAFVLLIVMAFLTRRSDDLSRGAVVLFYGAGFAALWSFRSLASRVTQVAARRGKLVTRRILVVGTEDGVATFLRRHRPWRLGFEVVGTVPFTADAPRAAKLAEAVALTRDLRLDDVYLAVPWSETDTIEGCIEAFLTTPVAIHLAPERVLDRFDQVTIARIGTIASLELTRPMSTAASAAKRAFDVVAASVGFVALLPVLALIALLIRLDSRGPVLFAQTRYGFNQRPFRIVKFRTMTTVVDDGEVPQAQRADPRVTRIGRILRRTNLDELPQLLNVVAGHMSLVGPRPHAVPHNRAYERRIALYARRHNVRPGMTGWAQVNGLRGETDTDEKMRARVAHDLFYIDNWSMLFDLRIILKTLLSAAAYRNAY